MIPFDFLNRYITKTNTRKQQAMKPRLDKINKQYAGNPEIKNQKTMELYKQENYSVMGTCLGMIASLAITILVFFTLLGSLNGIAAYKQKQEIIYIHQAYVARYEEVTQYHSGGTLTPEEISNLATAAAQQAALEKHDEVTTGFLWIRNIWRADTLTNSVPSFDNFASISGAYEVMLDIVAQNRGVTVENLTKSTDDGGLGYSPEQVENEFKDIFDNFMYLVRAERNRNNGMFILIVIAAGSSFISIQIPMWMDKARAKRKSLPVEAAGTNPNQAKMMMYIMPLIMAAFTFFSSSAFSIYIATSGLMMVVTAPLISLLVDFVADKMEKRKNDKNAITYSRKK